MVEMSNETVPAHKAEGLLAQLLTTCEGPKEAYGVLCLAIYMINFRFADNPCTIDELADGVATSLRSIRKHGTQ